MDIKILYIFQFYNVITITITEISYLCRVLSSIFDLRFYIYIVFFLLFLIKEDQFTLSPILNKNTVFIFFLLLYLIPFSNNMPKRKLSEDKEMEVRTGIYITSFK